MMRLQQKANAAYAYQSFTLSIPRVRERNVFVNTQASKKYRVHCFAPTAAVISEHLVRVDDEALCAGQYLPTVHRITPAAPPVAIQTSLRRPKPAAGLPVCQPVCLPNLVAPRPQQRRRGRPPTTERRAVQPAGGVPALASGPARYRRQVSAHRPAGGSARPDSILLGSARLGSAWPGPARLGSARLGSARLGSARFWTRLGSIPYSARLGQTRVGVWVWVRLCRL